MANDGISNLLLTANAGFQLTPATADVLAAVIAERNRQEIKSNNYPTINYNSILLKDLQNLNDGKLSSQDKRWFLLSIAGLVIRELETLTKQNPELAMIDAIEQQEGITQ